MSKGLKITIAAVAGILLIVGGYFLTTFVIGKVNKSSFISNAQKLYKVAMDSKSVGTTYYDSKSNKVGDSNLNYHIEFNNEGNIIYFLVYDKKNVIEVEEMNVTEKDFDNDKNYSNLSKQNSYQAIDYKHDTLNDRYLNAASKYNNVVDEESTAEEEPTADPVVEEPEPVVVPEKEEPVKPTPNVDPVVEEPKVKLTYTIDSKPYCEKVETKGHSEKYENGKYIYKVHMGKVPNGCYSIKITNVVLDGDDNVKIYVQNTFPSVNSNCTQAITYPCASVTFNRKPDNIETFEEGKISIIPSGETPKPETPAEDPKPSGNEKITYTVESKSYCKNLTSGESGNYENGKYVHKISMGSAPNGCYGIDVTNVIIDSNDNAKIYVQNRYPNVGDVCTQAITYPCAIVTFSRKPNNIETIRTGKVSTPNTEDNNSNSNTENLTYSINKTKNCPDITMRGYTAKKNSDGYLVNIGMGKVSHGGYSVKINSVNIDSSNNVTINAVTSEPPLDAVTTQAINYPCASITFNNEPNSLKILLDNKDINDTLYTK